MPTENRSSNTEMVSVPRERALQLINLLAGVASAAHWLADNSEDCGDEGIDCQRVDFEALSDALDKCEELPELPDSVYVRDGWLRAADELRGFLAQPAEQHQGEPAKYTNRLCHIDYTAHPYHCGCLKGDEEAQRIYDEHRNAARDEPSPKAGIPRLLRPLCRDSGALAGVEA